MVELSCYDGDLLTVVVKVRRGMVVTAIASTGRASSKCIECIATRMFGAPLCLVLNVDLVANLTSTRGSARGRATLLRRSTQLESFTPLGLHWQQFDNDVCRLSVHRNLCMCLDWREEKRTTVLFSPSTVIVW